MALTALGHALETVNDGLTVFLDGRAAPIPLVETRIDVAIRSGLATVRTYRRFRNVEERAIEALLTMPVGFDAVVTGLRATIDGRTLTAVAKEKEKARETYEEALDDGKLAVLHEELLRGIHMLSVGNLAPGKEVEVAIEAVSAISLGNGGALLRIPVTAGQLYGASPFQSSDDLVASDQVRYQATLTLTADGGEALLVDGTRLYNGASIEVTLDAAIEIRLNGIGFGTSLGRGADGRVVRVNLRPLAVGERSLDLAVLVDHSGSTGSPAGRNAKRTVWEAIRDGMNEQFDRLREDDRIDLWEFDSSVRRVGSATGRQAKALVSKLSGPAGGTELAGAVTAVLAGGAKDILILTDGQTWATAVDQLAQSKARISAILVSPGSLDANIGQLCAATGGQLFYAPGDDVGTSLGSAIRTLRSAASAAEGETAGADPIFARAVRGGVEIVAEWSPASELGGADRVGRFVAALAMPLLMADDAEAWARAHALCTHRTSLVLVDEAGEVVEGMAQTRKVPLMAGVSARPSYSAFGRSADVLPMMDFGVVASRQGRIPAKEQRAPRRLQSIIPFELETKDFEQTLVRQFSRVAWDEIGDALTSGDLSGLSVEQCDLIAQVARKAGVAELADSLGYSVETVAAAMIAAFVGERISKRFARRVLSSTPEHVWRPLLLSRDHSRMPWE